MLLGRYLGDPYLEVLHFFGFWLPTVTASTGKDPVHFHISEPESAQEWPSPSRSYRRRSLERGGEAFCGWKRLNWANDKERRLVFE